MVAPIVRADDTPNPIQTYSFDTCNFFTYSQELRVYICASTAGRINVPAATDVSKVVDQLTQRITELEARVKKLENPNPR